jgi:hypothetical protein
MSSAEIASRKTTIAPCATSPECGGSCSGAIEFDDALETARRQGLGPGARSGFACRQAAAVLRG